MKSFVVIAIGPGGKQVFDTIGTVEEFKTIEDARERARAVVEQSATAKRLSSTPKLLRGPSPLA